MKVTKLGYPQPILNSGIGLNTGGRVPPGGNDLQVLTSNGSNGRYWGENVRRITADGSNTLLSPDVNFASGSNITFSISSNTLTIHGQAGGGGGSSLTVADEGVDLSTAATKLDFVGAGVTATGAGATKTITIAGGGGSGNVIAQTAGDVTINGLAGSPDRKPASPDADDDEFDTTDTTDPIAGWTTLGTLDGLNTNSTRLSHLYLRKAANSATRIDGIYKAQTPPFTITARMTASTIRANYNRAGIFIGLATPGDIETCAIIEAATAQGEVLDMTNPTTYNATVAAVTLFAAGFGRALPWYLRIVVTSSTDVTYQVSADGSFWTTLVANRNPGFTVGSAGLFVNPQNASLDVEALFDWVRFT